MPILGNKGRYKSGCFVKIRYILPVYESSMPTTSILTKNLFRRKVLVYLNKENIGGWIVELFKSKNSSRQIRNELIDYFIRKFSL